MTYDLKVAEQMVQHLIADANRAHLESSWRYDITSDVDNIEVTTEGDIHTLRIHPCWLRFVVTQGDFKSCVADEIDAWYLVDQMTSDVTTSVA